MGLAISRYMDPASSEGALLKFIIESAHLVRVISTAGEDFSELTPWNVIDFRSETERIEENVASILHFSLRRSPVASYALARAFMYDGTDEDELNTPLGASEYESCSEAQSHPRTCVTTSDAPRIALNELDVVSPGFVSPTDELVLGLAEFY